MLCLVVTFVVPEHPFFFEDILHKTEAIASASVEKDFENGEYKSFSEIYLKNRHKKIISVVKARR